MRILKWYLIKRLSTRDIIPNSGSASVLLNTTANSMYVGAISGAI